MTDAFHPIWSLIRLGMILAFLSWILWANATTFDETELKVIGLMAVGLMTGEFVQKRFYGSVKVRDDK